MDAPLFLNYSLHAVFVAFLGFIFFSHHRWANGGLWLFCLGFLGYQISTIVESETTLKIISHTKLSLCYILFLLATISVAILRFSQNIRTKKVGFWVYQIIVLQSILYYLCYQLTGVGFNESIPFHLKSGIKGAGVGDFSKLMIDIALLLILWAITSIFYYLKWMKEGQSIRFSFGFLLPIILIINPLNYDIWQTYRNVEERPDFMFKDFYHGPRPSLTSDKKYNLVWIYAEAFERIYLNEQIFPKLTPHLSALERESLSFSNVHQVWGTGWTIAGIVSSQCGVPLYAVGRQNNDLDKLPAFLPKVKGIGNILREDGYENIFIQGSPKAFAGNDKFLESHGFTMYALENIDKKYKSPKDISRWGVNDDRLLEFAKEQFIALQKSQKPFSLMLSTINTHSPRGFIPPDYRHKKYQKGDNITLNAFHISDELIGKFIREIRALDKDKKTIIVVSSDHLTMRNMASHILEKHPEHRRNLFMVNLPNAEHKGIVSREASALDEGVTVLDLMGYDVEKLGFGVSLMSSQNTLREKAQEQTDDILKSWKKHYFRFWE